MGAVSSNPFTIAVAAASGPIATLGLTSEVGGDALPFTVGQVFPKGVVPQGADLVSDAEAFQADVRNRWEDGSVKLAVLSGLANLVAGQTRTLTLRYAPSPDTAPVITEDDLRAALDGSDAVVTLSSVRTNAGTTLVPAATCSLAACIGATASFGADPSAHAAGLVRSFPGRVMSEFHYYGRTGDAQLAVWWYVRAYRGGRIEVETVVENGWLRAANPGDRRYSVTVTIAGTQTLAHAFDDVSATQQRHFHHTRWRRVDWIHGDPRITPQHDGELVQRSRLVPNFHKEGIARSTLAIYANNEAAFPTLLTMDGGLRPPLPQHRSMMSKAGSAPGGPPGYLGLVTRYQAAYLMDPTYAEGYWAGEADVHAYGIKSVWYRDETTGTFPALASYPTLGINGAVVNHSYGVPPAPMMTPAPDATPSTHTFDHQHIYPVGYASYLLTGRWTHLETLHAVTTFALLTMSTSSRQQGTFLIQENIRYRAWTLRTLGNLVTVWPDAMRAQGFPDFQAILESNLTWAAEHVACPNLGISYVTPELDNGGYGMHDVRDPTYRYDAIWMVWYMGQVLALLDNAELGISQAARAALRAVRDVEFKGVVGMAVPGRTATGFNWRYIGAYTLPLTTFSPRVEAASTWKELFEIFVATPAADPHSNYGVTLDEPDDDGLALLTSGGNPNESPTAWNYTAGRLNNDDGFAGQHVDEYLCVLAEAVDAGYPNAEEAWARVTGASNYRTSAARGFPEFMHLPRLMT